MLSDSSDDDNDAFDENFIDDEILHDSRNIGLAIESYKYSRGEKGRLVTNHCNPRALQKDPYQTLSGKMNKTVEELKIFQGEFDKIQYMNKNTADGLMIGLITNSCMTKREASHIFHIGSGRWTRLVKKLPAQKGHGLNGQQILQEDLQHLHDFLSSLEVELGYPCKHRKMKRYSADYDTYKGLWSGYVGFNPTGKLPRKMKASTFQKYLKKVHPDFELHRAKEDECDTCIRLKIIICDERATEGEKTEARQGLIKHNGDSREMRVAMQTAIAEFGKQIIPCNSDLGVMDNFKESLDRMPESIDDAFPEESVVSTFGPDQGGKPTVRIQCEDYGGNFCLPWYGARRPCIDYYLSNLAIYMFVISNLTSGINSVYLYDERAMGKNADAMCSLRFIYHLRLYNQARLSNAIGSFPNTLYIVMDNCVGQNKSQVVMMFMSFLSMTFYKRVICHYLVSGHSHMCPDRVVSHAKRSIGVNDIFEPQGFVQKMNTVRHGIL
jgi:hypothetical protein